MCSPHNQLILRTRHGVHLARQRPYGLDEGVGRTGVPQFQGLQKKERMVMQTDTRALSFVLLHLDTMHW